jgi:hypothetical protein
MKKQMHYIVVDTKRAPCKPTTWFYWLMLDGWQGTTNKKIVTCRNCKRTRAFKEIKQ